MYDRQSQTLFTRLFNFRIPVSARSKWAGSANRWLDVTSQGPKLKPLGVCHLCGRFSIVPLLVTTHGHMHLSDAPPAEGAGANPFCSCDLRPAGARRSPQVAVNTSVILPSLGPSSSSPNTWLHPSVFALKTVSLETAGV